MDKGPLKFHSQSQADIELPREFERLREMAYNLWWAWNPRARRMFSHINPGLWAIYRNPVEMLINIEPHHWEAFLEDDSFLTTYRSLTRELDNYMRGWREAWFAKNYPEYTGGPFAYFSTEFGLTEALSSYSGGLGILSGDHCKSASDLGLPFVGVGLLYKNGYFDQEIEPDGRQQHFYPRFDFTRLPIRPLLGGSGRQQTVEIEFPNRSVYAAVWLAQVGRIPTLLLDTDISKNEPADRPITGQLYVSGREMRLCQEIVLGMGGVRALHALGIEPACWHMNEGHSAFLVLERARWLVVKNGLSFADACKEVSKNSIFTTHTPVPAGNEAFDVGLIRKYFANYSKEMQISLDQLIELGLPPGTNGHEPFSMTVLALHLSRFSNGVSQLHAQVSNEMWQHVFRGLPAEKHPIKAVTNGVHTETWLGFQTAELFDKYLTPAWRDNLMDDLFWKRGVANIPNRELWEVHNLQKDTLIRYARTRVRNTLARHGCSPDELRTVEELLDPHALTIGFARRFATYKRADLLFRDFDRLRKILKNPDRPVQILFAGKAHPADKAGQDLIRRIWEVSLHSDLRGRIVFLENYNMRVARVMVCGVDVWLNTPRRPQEASGTSGMKAPVNGAINFSISDGWWPEAANNENGWTIGSTKPAANDDAQDAADSESLYKLLEEKIIPLYYKRDAEGLPQDWIKTMKSSIATILPRFSTARMVRDYTEKFYLPAARAVGAQTAEAEKGW